MFVLRLLKYHCWIRDSLVLFKTLSRLYFIFWSSTALAYFSRVSPNLFVFSFNRIRFLHRYPLSLWLLLLASLRDETGVSQINQLLFLFNSFSTLCTLILLVPMISSRTFFDHSSFDLLLLRCLSNASLDINSLSPDTRLKISTNLVCFFIMDTFFYGYLNFNTRM